jgi:hypothetical protein
LKKNKITASILYTLFGYKALGIPSTTAQDKFRVNPFLFRKDWSLSISLRINSKPAPFYLSPSFEHPSPFGEGKRVR